MAITFTYDESTNIVVVTGGTAETPATLADFVTADRAGEAVLLAATGCAKDMSLTYPIRPVGLRALLISFIIASKTAEADFIFITGTDFAGNAQTESIDISAGNGTYVSTKYFRTITDIDVEDVGDGSGAAAADGTLQVTQPQWGVIWDYGVGQYQIDCEFVIGDGGTSTYFTSLREAVTFSTGFAPWIFASATLQIGDKTGDYGYKGSYWSLESTYGGYAISPSNNAGTLLMYSSLMENRGDLDLRVYGPITVLNSIIQFRRHDDGHNPTSRMILYSTATVNFDSVYYNDAESLLLVTTPVTFNNVWGHYLENGLEVQADATVKSLKLTSEILKQLIFKGAGVDGYVINPRFDIDNLYLGTATTTASEQYIVNIKIVDKDGTGIVGATVLCESSDSGTASEEYDVEEFSVDTGASGVLAEQTVTAKKWVGTLETLTNYNYFKFTISEPGYETLVMEKVTIDAPIDWHLELQDEVVYPDIVNVLLGVSYGDGGVEFIGTLDIMSPVWQPSVGGGGDMNQFPDIRDLPDGLDEGVHGALSDIKECLEVMLSRRSNYLPVEDYDPVNKNYIDQPIGIEKTEAKLYAGTGSPEDEVVAEKGSVYLRTDGGANTSIYIKETGTENTGWIAK